VTGSTSVFRLFVSSTFADLKVERTALQREVFPRLRRLCARHEASFQPIDLRWGISAEAGLEQLTMRICLAEVQRCQQTTPRPNFMVLVGDRYGWRPLPAEIPAAEFAVLRELAVEPSLGHLLQDCYRRDNNAVPPVYLLLPRPRRGRSQTEQEWESLESRLRDALADAAVAAGFPTWQAVKYCGSATEQEIQAGLFDVPGAEEHVACFVRDTANLPHDARAGDFADLDADGRYDEDARRRLEDLKDRLAVRLGPRLMRYEASWTEAGVTQDHVAALCDDVYAALSSVILAELETAARDTDQQEELAARDFAEARTQFFVGREAPLSRIASYLADGVAQPLAVVGNPGTGKSSLMARAALVHEQSAPASVLIMRFIGTTPGTSDLRSLLEDLTASISQRYEVAEPVGLGVTQLAEELPARLALATAERPLVVFLDALDQLPPSEGGQELTWLPASLPPHARLVVSTTEGPCLDALRRKLASGQITELDVMPATEGAELLGHWLAGEYRGLQPEQRRLVLDAFAACPLPLYLRLAFEQARSWRSFDEPPPLTLSVAGLIRDLFARLSLEAAHGPLLTSRVLGFLAAARFGLAEEEVLGALALDDEFCRDFFAGSVHSLPTTADGGRAIPIVLWSRLFYDLRRYLTERGKASLHLFTFFHKQLAEVATEMYLAESGTTGQRLTDGGRARHRVLAQYFHRLADPEGDCTWGADSPRGLSELPYHLTQAEEWDELTSTLTDFGFLENKATKVAVRTRLDDDEDVESSSYDGVYRLLDDYRLALESFPGGKAPDG